MMNALTLRLRDSSYFDQLLQKLKKNKRNNMKYSISQVSKMAGVSIRTLHFYDEQKLLQAHRNPNNGYREYHHEHMIKLQQILIYRQMDFSIEQIKVMLEQNPQSLFESLKSQKLHLEQKSDQLKLLIEKIEVSMNNLDKQRIDQTLYEGIEPEKVNQWQQQTKENYCEESINKSYQRLSKHSDKQLKNIKLEGENIAIEFAKNLDKAIDSEQIQTLIKRHHQWIENFYEATYEIYVGLANMYLQSEEFTQFYDKHKKGSTEHLAQAMIHFANIHLK